VYSSAGVRLRSRTATTVLSWRRQKSCCWRKSVVVMRRYFGSTDWRTNITVFLIILFFMPPLFLVAYKLGVYVRDHYYFPRITEQALKKERDRALRKREVSQQWGSANCGENFERALHEDQWMVKELTESEEAAQEALSQIRAARLRSCRDLGYGD
jgi:hypothetical protein